MIRRYIFTYIKIEKRAIALLKLIPLWYNFRISILL